MLYCAHICQSALTKGFRFQKKKKLNQNIFPFPAASSPLLRTCHHIRFSFLLLNADGQGNRIFKNSTFHDTLALLACLLAMQFEEWKMRLSICIHRTLKCQEYVSVLGSIRIRVSKSVGCAKTFWNSFVAGMS